MASSRPLHVASGGNFGKDSCNNNNNSPQKKNETKKNVNSTGINLEANSAKKYGSELHVKNTAKNLTHTNTENYKENTIEYLQNSNQNKKEKKCVASINFPLRDSNSHTPGLESLI